MTIHELPDGHNRGEERLATDLERIAHDLEKLVSTVAVCVALLAGILVCLALQVAGFGA